MTDVDPQNLEAIRSEIVAALAFGLTIDEAEALYDGLAETLAERDAAVAIIHDIAANSHVSAITWLGDGSSRCRYCAAEGYKETPEHAADCVWSRALVALGEVS